MTQKQLSEDDIGNCIGIVEEVIDSIDSALYELDKVVRLLRLNGHITLSERIRMYPIGNIRNFTERNGEHQIGNLVTDIQTSLEELRRPCDEDLRAVGYEWARDQMQMDVSEIRSYASSFAHDLSEIYNHDGHCAEMIHEGIQDRVQELEGKEHEQNT